MGYLSAFIAISLLVFFHELGHFLAAKIFGVRVLTFSVGFGKKILSFKRGGTIYCISLIPLGGYVKLKGEEDSNLDGWAAVGREHEKGRNLDSKNDLENMESKTTLDSNLDSKNLEQKSSIRNNKEILRLAAQDDGEKEIRHDGEQRIESPILRHPEGVSRSETTEGSHLKILPDSKNIESKNDSLSSKHPLKRIIIFLAGPAFNIFLAFFVYVFLCLFSGVSGYSSEAIVGSVSKDYKAYQKLESYDKIIAINDINITNFIDISRVLNNF